MPYRGPRVLPIYPHKPGFFERINQSADEVIPYWMERERKKEAEEDEAEARELRDLALAERGIYRGKASQPSLQPIVEGEIEAPLPDFTTPEDSLYRSRQRGAHLAADTPFFDDVGSVPIGMDPPADLATGGPPPVPIDNAPAGEFGAEAPPGYEGVPPADIGMDPNLFRDEARAGQRPPRPPKTYAPGAFNPIRGAFEPASIALPNVTGFDVSMPNQRQLTEDFYVDYDLTPEGRKQAAEAAEFAQMFAEANREGLVKDEDRARARILGLEETIKFNDKIAEAERSAAANRAEYEAFASTLATEGLDAPIYDPEINYAEEQLDFILEDYRDRRDETQFRTRPSKAEDEGITGSEARQILERVYGTQDADGEPISAEDALGRSAYTRAYEDLVAGRKRPSDLVAGPQSVRRSSEPPSGERVGTIPQGEFSTDIVVERNDEGLPESTMRTVPGTPDTPATATTAWQRAAAEMRADGLSDDEIERQLGPSPQSPDRPGPRSRSESIRGILGPNEAGAAEPIAMEGAAAARSRGTTIPDTRFDRALARVLREEGGFNPDDAGSPTMMGIRAANHRGHDHKSPTDPTFSAADARDIYQEEYWAPMGFDSVRAPEVSTLLFDAGIQHAPKTFGKLVQAALKAMGKPAGSTWGPEQIVAINEVDPGQFRSKFAEVRTQWWHDNYSPEWLEKNSGVLGRAARP